LIYCSGAWLLKPTQKGSLLGGNYFYGPNITLEETDNYTLIDKKMFSFFCKIKANSGTAIHIYLGESSFRWRAVVGDGGEACGWVLAGVNGALKGLVRGKNQST
jgi:hypothetical protein